MPNSAATQNLRSRSGCWTCRFRKKKCDETRPVCNHCVSLRLVCDSPDIEQPTYMKDPDAAAIKKKEIRAQMGKCTRKRKKKSEIASERLKESQDRSERSTSLSSEDTSLGGSPESNDAPMEIQEEDEDEDVEEIGSGSSEVGYRPVTEFPATQEPPRKTSIMLVHRPRSPSPVSDPVFFTTGPSVPPSIADIFLASGLPLNLRQLTLLKYYALDVISYTYGGMKPSYRASLVRDHLLPHCQNNLSFLHGCLSAGALHLLNTTKNNNCLVPPKLDLEMAAYQASALKGLKEQLNKPTLDPYRLLTGIIILLNYTINADTPTYSLHLSAACRFITKHMLLPVTSNSFLLSIPTPSPPNLPFTLLRVYHLSLLSSAIYNHPPLLPSNTTLVSPLAAILKVHTGVRDAMWGLLSTALSIRHAHPPMMLDSQAHLAGFDHLAMQLLADEGMEEDPVDCAFLHSAQIIARKGASRRDVPREVVVGLRRAVGEAVRRNEVRAVILPLILVGCFSCGIERTECGKWIQGGSGGGRNVGVLAKVRDIWSHAWKEGEEVEVRWWGLEEMGGGLLGGF